jgi:hypothetical protein
LSRYHLGFFQIGAFAFPDLPKAAPLKIPFKTAIVIVNFRIISTWNCGRSINEIDASSILGVSWSTVLTARTSGTSITIHKLAESDIMLTKKFSVSKNRTVFKGMCLTTDNTISSVNPFRLYFGSTNSQTIIVMESMGLWVIRNINIVQVVD